MTGPTSLGETIGSYVLESVLGQGGMGTVFLGKHHLLGRRAAVKVLSSELASDEGLVSRFFHEAKVVNDVKHPNIVDVIDFVRTPERVAFVMEFLEGRSLDAKIKHEGALTVPQAINAILQVASGLCAVHDIGVIHRDLKPANLRFTQEEIGDCSYVPILKILDFGIAKAADTMVAHKTQTGVVLGTPSYMAPEQVAGDPVSPATDIYAIGEILYELLTGERLFVGQNAQIMRRKLGGDVPEIVLPEDMPHRSRLTQIIHACLAFDGKDRPSGVSLVEQLTQIRDGLTTSPQTYPPSRAASGAPAATPSPAPQEAALLAETLSSPVSGVEPPPPRRTWMWPAGGALLLAAGAAFMFAGRSSGIEVHTIPTEPAVVKTAEAPEKVEPPPPVPVAEAPAEPKQQEPKQQEPKQQEPKQQEPKQQEPKKQERPERVVRRPHRRRRPKKPPRRVKPPPKVEARPAKAELGRLKVTAWTTAGRRVPARVKIDGKSVGKSTPFDIKTAAGKRTLTVSARGYPVKQQTVVVRPGESTSIDVVVDLQ